MKVLVVVSAVLAVAAAQYLPYSGYGYSGYPYGAGYWNGAWNNNWAAPLTYAAAPEEVKTYAAYPYARYGYAAPAVASSQYHAQNAIGGYNYGYADGLSTKHESKNAFGATIGSYSYLDSNNKVQTVNYVADAAGYRVEGTNLPVAPVADLEAPVHNAVAPMPVEDTADVRAAKAEFRMAYAAAAQAAAEGATPVVTYMAGPAPVDDTDEVKAAKAEFRMLYAEAAAAAAAAPDARKKRSLEAPLPVDDTPEVKAAKAEHARLYAAAAAAAEAAPDFPYYPLAYSGHPWMAYGAHPMVRGAGFSYGFNSAHLAWPYGRYY